MKDIHIYLIALIGIIAIGFFIGWEFAGILGVAGGGYEVVRRENEKKIKEKKEEAEQKEQDYEEMKAENDKDIEEAGDIDAKEYSDHNNAADSINDIFSDRSE